jgi:UTP--glucose-1-phosphate uridylyltransferase
MIEHPPVRKGVILAAGHGTRLLPVTKAVPKEALPLVDKPIIHYVVQEAIDSGIEQIVMVTSAGKRAVEDYFDRSPGLKRLEEKGTPSAGG